MWNVKMGSTHVNRVDVASRTSTDATVTTTAETGAMRKIVQVSDREKKESKGD